MLRRFVVVAIPLLVQGRISQPEIRREVNDFGREAEVAVYLLLRFAVGQGEEQHVARLKGLLADELQLRPFAEIWMLLINVLARVALRGDLRDFDVRVE